MHDRHTLVIAVFYNMRGWEVILLNSNTKMWVFQISQAVVSEKKKKTIKWHNLCKKLRKKSIPFLISQKWLSQKSLQWNYGQETIGNQYYLQCLREVPSDIKPLISVQNYYHFMYLNFTCTRKKKEKRQRLIIIIIIITPQSIKPPEKIRTN